MTDSGVKNDLFLLLSGGLPLITQFPAQRINGARVKRNYLKAVALSPHPSMGLVLSQRLFWTPHKTETVLPGVWLAKLEGFLHEQPPLWRQ